MTHINAFETYEERIIRYADTLILNSDYTGILDKQCLDIFGAFDNDKEMLPVFKKIRQELIEWAPNSLDENGTHHLDVVSNYVSNNFESVWLHLVNNGYIGAKDQYGKWILNDEGKIMKRHESHEKYQKYLRDKLKAEKGSNSVKIEGNSFAAGVYIYSLSNGEKTITKRMIVSGK